ncbi:unnamed protein product [Coregonus sp. 'balchen']|nr:unnamed protein product [Coregonus sp. 'balchen']
MFKGPDWDINAIFTRGPCHATLETNKEYLFTGAVFTSVPDECLWMDNGKSGPWARNVACIKVGDGSCAWYKG